MAINAIDFGFDNPMFEYFKQIQRMCDKLYNPAILESVRQTQKFFSQLGPSYMMSVEAAIKSVEYIFPQLQETIDITQRFSQQYAPVLDAISVQQKWLSDIIPSLDFSLKEAVSSSFQQSSFAGINTFLTTFENRIDALNLSNEEYSGSVDDLSDADSLIVTEEIIQAVEDKANWQQRLMTILLKYKEKNPVIAWIVQKIIFVLIISIVAGVIIDAIGQVFKPATVRKAPETSSSIVYQINAPQTVIITGEVPYYYEIQFTMPDTQEQITGYISKRSVEDIQIVSSPQTGDCLEEE